MEVSKSKSMKSRQGDRARTGRVKVHGIRMPDGPAPIPWGPYFQFFRPQCCTRTLLDLTFSCRGYAHGMVRRRDEPRPPTPREPSRARGWAALLPEMAAKPTKFVEEPPALVCPACKRVFREPVHRCILVKCVHTFCRGCIEELIRAALHIEELIREGGTCPLDRQECDSAQLVLNWSSTGRHRTGACVRVRVSQCVYTTTTTTTATTTITTTTTTTVRVQVCVLCVLTIILPLSSVPLIITTHSFTPISPLYSFTTCTPPPLHSPIPMPPRSSHLSDPLLPWCYFTPLWCYP